MDRVDCRRVMLVSHGGSFDGGAELAFDELVQGLRKVAPDVLITVVVPYRGELSQRAAAAGASVIVVTQPRWADFGDRRARLWIRNILLLGVSTMTLWRHIKTQRPDVVVTNTMTIPAAAIAARLTSVKHIWLIHEFGRKDHHLTFLLGYERTMRIIGRLSSYVVCCSRAIQSELLGMHIPAAKLSVAYGSVNMSRTPEHPNLRDQDDVLIAIVVGRITPSKGQLLAIEALAEARRAGVNAKLRLVGAPYDIEYLKEINSLIDRECLESSVELTGNLVDPSAEYASSHVYLMCSKWEAFGRVTVEAMKCGLPVIGFNSGGTSELIDDGVTGYLVQPGSIHEIAERLVSLWNDESARRRMGEEAKNRAESRFTNRQVATRILELMNS